MKSLAIVAFSILLLTGCSTMESAAKGTFSIAWDAAEQVVAAKFPALEGKVMEYAREQADRAVDAACKYAAQKAVDAADAAVDKGIRDYKIDVSDVNGITDLLDKIRAENERRKESGEDPIGTYGTLVLLGLLSTFQVGKSAVRVLRPQPQGKAKP